MMSTPAQATDIVTNLIGATGAFAYCIFLLRRTSRSRLENSILFLLGAFAAGLVSRSILIANGMIAMTRFNWAIGAILPLAFALFCESLLRRHLPFAFKIYLALTTTTFLFTSVLGMMSGKSIPFYAFIAHLLVFLGWLNWIFIRRDRKDLSPAENSMIESTIVTFWVMVPLYITDFHQFSEIFHQRFGVIAALLFVCSLVRFSPYGDGKTAMARDLFLRCAEGLAIAGAGYLIMSSIEGVTEKAPYLFLHLLALSLSVVLLYRIGSQIRTLELRTRNASFLSWLADSPMDSLSSFLDSIKDIRSEQEHMIIGSKELAGYDSQRILDLFERTESATLRLSQLRDMIRKKSIEDPYAAEQLADLLIEKGMNYASPIRSEPLLLLLMNIPQAGQEELAGLQTRLIGKITHLIKADA